MQIYLSSYLSACLCTNLSSTLRSCLAIYLSVFLLFFLSLDQPLTFNLTIYLFACLSAYLPACLPISTLISVSLPCQHDLCESVAPVTKPVPHLAKLLRLIAMKSAAHLVKVLHLSQNLHHALQKCRAPVSTSVRMGLATRPGQHCHNAAPLTQSAPESALVSICLPVFSHSLPGLEAVTRWSGLVSPLSPHLFPHALAGLDAVTTWSGSVSPLSPHLFAFVSPLVSSRACWAGRCHETVWLGRLFVFRLFPLLSPHLFPHVLAGLDAVTRWSGSVSSLSPRLFPFVSPLVFSRTCWAGRCHEMVWLGRLFVSPLVSFCLPTCFLTCLLG